MILIPYVQKFLALAGRCASRLFKVVAAGLLVGVFFAFCIKGCGVTLELMNERPLLKKIR